MLHEGRCIVRLEARPCLSHHCVSLSWPRTTRDYFDVVDKRAPPLDVDRCRTCAIEPIVTIPIRSNPCAARSAAVQPGCRSPHHILGDIPVRTPLVAIDAPWAVAAGSYAVMVGRRRLCIAGIMNEVTALYRGWQDLRRVGQILERQVALSA